MDRARASWNDVMLACLLAALLTFGWAVRDWSALSALHLPDTDDGMRLQQIRDWLAGQSFADLSQHRLANGLAMHWSRLPDLVPGGIIAALTPWLGRHAAELTAVIAWPAILLAAALALIASIARGLQASPRTAFVIAGLSWPATTLFVPGRIDHHNLQILLCLIIVRALLAAASLRTGLAIAASVTASLVIGLETAPFLALAGAWVAFEWSRGEDRRMAGLALGLMPTLLIARGIFASAQWSYPACDGFTGIAWRAAMIVALVPPALWAAGRMTHHRLLALALIGGSCGALALWASPACLNPYGQVDPLLVRLWLSKVGEAQPLLQASFATAIGYTGVMAAGVLAGLWQVRTDRRWAIPLAFQAAALAFSFVQLRYAYLGAILAAPALAQLVGIARTKGAAYLAAAWIASAGMLYPIAAQALAKPETQPGACALPGTLAALKPGRMLSPPDLGAYAIASTGMTAIAAPYHRNNAGNLAAYRFLLGTPGQARAIAQAWRLDYVALCPGDLPHQSGLVRALEAGHHPAWLTPIIPSGATPIVYRVDPTLSQAPATH